MNRPGRASTAVLMILLLVGISLFALMPADGEPGTYFYGYITDEETGEPLDDVQLWVYANKRAKTAYTNEEGYYEYHLKKGGDYTIVTNANGYYQQMREESINVGEQIRVDFALEPYGSYISGYVTDSDTGRPVEGAFVEYRNSDIWSSNITDDTGHYSIWIEPGTFDLRVDSTQYHIYNEEGVVIEEGDQNRKDIRLDPFDTGIFGYVCDEDGNPVDGAVIKIDSNDGYKGDWADEDGYYKIGLEPGFYRVSVYRSGYYKSSAPVEIEDGEMLEMDWTLADEVVQSLFMRLISWIMGMVGIIS